MAGVGAAHRVYEAFGAEVRKERDKLGWTQLELSRRIGLTRGSVANIEAGRQSVLLHQFLAIASALKLEPSHLLPAATETPPAEEPSDMPETVLNAVQTIRRSAAPRLPSRR
ncbi:MAG TPA: helix-turn-helix transcriptional regulator [Acetobacteraceae bacterium]|nr:helix-turn-helix transcriptional regulator [Acetobacteraceae bacterium]